MHMYVHMYVLYVCMCMYVGIMYVSVCRYILDTYEDKMHMYVRMYLLALGGLID